MALHLVILISTHPPTSTLRVFLFVDPELVSPSVCSALLLEIQAAQTQQTPEACMRHVVSHTLQAALGGACRVDALQRKLQVIPCPALWGPVLGLPCTHQPLTLLVGPLSYCHITLVPKSKNNTHALRKA